MKVLVTGAAGFIGSEVVRCLLAEGHQAVAVVRPGRAADRLAPFVSQVHVSGADIQDTPAMRGILKSERPEAIIHLAWYAHPADYLISRENLTSLTGTNTLIALALDEGCRKIVAAGTCLEYADLPRPRRESDPVAPVSLYAACKQAAGQVAQALCTAGGAELAWGRLFHLHGPHEAPGRLIPWVAEKLRRGEPVELTDGTQVRDHLHVTDAASAFVALLAPGARGVFNVCSGTPVTLRQVLEVVGGILGRPEQLRFGARPHRSDEVMFLVGDASRLMQLGWRPRWSLEQGLEDAIMSRRDSAA